jgi:hypothetical protein
MGYFPVWGGGNTGQSLGVTPGTEQNGVTIANSGVANTKSSWVTIGSTLTRMASGIRVLIEKGSVADIIYLVDIGIGAGGSEVVIASNLLFVYDTGSADNVGYYDLPIQLPAGTQLSARIQTAGTSGTVNVAIQAIYSGLHTQSFQGADMLGVTLASTTLATVTRPAGNNVKGAWLQYTASSARRYRGMAQAYGLSGGSTQLRLIDVGIGAAASEQVVIADVSGWQNTGGDIHAPINTYVVFPCDIPAGTRIAARVQQDVIGAGRDLTMGLLMYW